MQQYLPLGLRQIRYVRSSSISSVYRIGSETCKGVMADRTHLSYVIAEGGDLDYANDRHQSKGGVLCMYVSTKIHLMIIQDLNLFLNI